MKKLILFWVFLFIGLTGFAQELNFPVIPEKPRPIINIPEKAQPEISFPLIPEKASLFPSIPERTQPQIAFPEVPDRMLTFKVDRFDGGLNLFWPVDQSNIIRLLNFVPEGLLGLKKRDGKQKIYFTSRGSIHGMAIGDSARAKPHLVVVANDSLYWADSSSSWELASFGATTAEATYFTSTPFGLVISNDGSDSTRIWDGISLVGLGICDTGTVDANGDSVYSADTVWVSDSSACWTTDEWIGYYLYFTSVDSLWKILDNGSNWFLAVTTAAGDTNRAATAFKIISQADSMTSDLIYPKGQATAYYQDRLFVSSAYYPWRIYYSHVFAKYSMYGVDRSLNVYPISKNIGCVAPNAIALGDNFIYWPSARGIYRMEGNIYGSLSYKPDKISDQINDIFDKIDPKNLENSAGVYTDRQYWFSYHPDSSLVFDERTNFWGSQSFGFTNALNYSNVFSKTWSEILLPSADGDTITWVPSAGSDHYACINAPLNTTKYVSADSNGDLDIYDFSNTTRFPVGAKVEYIIIYVQAKNSANYTMSDLQIYLHADTTTGHSGREQFLLGELENFPTTWTVKQLQVTTNPITNSAWTKGDLDSLRLAIKYDQYGYGAGQQQNVACLWTELRYEADLVSRSFLFGSVNKEFVYKYGGIFTDDTRTGKRCGRRESLFLQEF